MTIKAIIFDLDDTLFDCSNTLVDSARIRAAGAMVNAGLKASPKEIYRRLTELSVEFPRSDIFDKISEYYKIKDQRIIDAGINAYNSETVERIKPFPDVANTLEELRKKYKLVLITHGLYKRQKRKIEILGLGDKFDLVIINDAETGDTKDRPFHDALRKFMLKPEEVVSVGDRIYSEIKIANEMGITTVQMVHGRFSGLSPKSDSERPDYKIKRIGEMFSVLEKINSRKPIRIVAIGGGTGLPVLLEGLKKHTKDLTAIVTVMDSGRSSGILRKEFNTLPPGDVRNCLIALSNSEKVMRDLFQYRFENGSLNGHSFGNLFITALAKVTGSFEKSLEETSKILKLNGRVLPSTLDDTHLCAEFEDGRIVEKEDRIRKNGGKIKKVFLKSGNVKPYEEALREIEKADAIVIGPGSLYTSIIPNLLVTGISDAIRKSKARKIYVCNIVTQQDQTHGFTASDHVETVEKYLGGNVLDYVVLNDKMPGRELLKHYENENSFIVKNNISDSDNSRIKVVKADIIENLGGKRSHWNKKDYIRHDPDKLAKSVLKCVGL